MNKFILTFMALAATVAVHAAEFGVTAGVGAASIAADRHVIAGAGSLGRAEVVYDRVVSWNVGAKVNENFTDKVFGEASLLFQHQGYTHQRRGTVLSASASGKKYDVDLYYINLPMNVGYKFAVANSFSIAPKAGILFGFGVAGNDDESDLNPFSDLEDESNGVYDDYKRFDFGINAGANFNYKKVQLGLQYTWGLPDFIESVNSSKNHVFSANLAYFF